MELKIGRILVAFVKHIITFHKRKIYSLLLVSFQRNRIPSESSTALVLKTTDVIDSEQRNKNKVKANKRDRAEAIKIIRKQNKDTKNMNKRSTIHV